MEIMNQEINLKIIVDYCKDIFSESQEMSGIYSALFNE